MLIQKKEALQTICLCICFRYVKTVTLDFWLSTEFVDYTFDYTGSFCKSKDLLFTRNLIFSKRKRNCLQSPSLICHCFFLRNHKRVPISNVLKTCVDFSLFLLLFNVWFSHVFRGYKQLTLGTNGLRKI